MTGQQIGTVVGTIAGFWLPGGPSVWGTIGGYVGGVISPTVLHGPSIGDAQAQTSMAGMPIPKCYGRPPPIAPTVIDGDKIARKVTRTSGGKGSTTVQEQEGFIATRAFLVCEGEIVGYARIKRNGKLVYSTVPGDNLDAESAAFASQITIYTGTQTQGPDPSLEAIHGVGETPYYRGRSYFVVRDDDETQTGGTPNQYRIEVAACGTVTENIDATRSWYAVAGESGKFISSPGGIDWSAAKGTVTAGPHAYVTAVSGDRKVLLFASSDAGEMTADAGASWTSMTGLPVGVGINSGIFALDPSGTNGTFILAHNGETVSTSADGIAWASDAFAGTYNIQKFVQFKTDAFGLPSIKVALFSYVSATSGDLGLNWDITPGWLFTATESATDAALDAYDVLTVVGDDGSIKQSIDRAATFVTVTNPFANPTSRICSIAHTGGLWVMVNLAGEVAYSSSAMTGAWTVAAQTIVPAGDRSLHGEDGVFVLGSTGGTIWTSTNGGSWTSQPNPYSGGGSIYSIVGPGPLYGTPLPDASGWYVDAEGNLSGPGGTRISDCSAEWRDIAADIAERSHPLLVDQLDIAHMTDDVPGFVLGNATLTGTDYMRTLCTLYFVDGSEYDNQWHAVRRGGAVVATFDEDDLLAIEQEDDDTRDQALKGFKRVTVMYPDPANNYVPTPQTAPRTSPDVVANNEITIECPIPFDADTMAQKADILQKIAFLQLEGTFKRNFRAQYSKYVTSDPVEFKGRRYLLEKVSNDDSMVRFEGTYDRVSAYTSLASGNSGPPPAPQTSNLKGPTIGLALNLPSLRSEDNTPGMYLAASRVLPGWAGADAYISFDGGVSERLVKTILTSARMGVLTEAVDTDGNDSNGLITVRTYGDAELSSVTEAQFEDGANGFAITTAGVSEIGNYQTATEDSNGNFDLTNVARGEMTTTAAAHNAGDRFVMLDDMVFLPIDVKYAGRTLRYRFVSRGTAIARNETFDVVYLPQFTSAPSIDFYETELGEVITTESGDYLQVD